MKNKIIANPSLQKLNYILSKKQIISLFNLFISNKISLETSIEPETSSSLKRDIIIKRNDHYPLFWNYSNYQTRFFSKMVAKGFENRFFFFKHYLPDMLACVIFAAFPTLVNTRQG